MRRLDETPRRPGPFLSRSAWQTASVHFFGTLTAIFVVAAPGLRTHGLEWMFRGGDPVFFRAIAHDPFGDGSVFADLGIANQASYRYARIGFPLLSWLLAFGNKVPVEWVMTGLHWIALAAIPALTGLLLRAYGARQASGILTLLTPGLLFVVPDRVYVDPFMLAVVLAGYVLETYGYRRSAACTLAFAVLAKETAALAVLPLIWRAIRRRDRRAASVWCATLAPYVAWVGWVRLRVGTFPFLAPARERRDALRPPFEGMREVLERHAPDAQVVVAITITVAALGFLAAWLARGTTISGATLLFSVLALCLGPEALRLGGETLRLLAITQVFTIVALLSRPRIGHRPLR